MNSIHIYSEFPLTDECFYIQINAIKTMSMFDNKNVILTDKNREVEQYVLNNFAILKRECNQIMNKYTLDKKIITLHICDVNNTNKNTMTITEKVSNKIGYIKCCKDCDISDIYTIIIPDNLYFSSLKELINITNESSNYLSVDDIVLDKFYSYENKYDFFKEISESEYALSHLFNISDSLFVKYFLIYLNTNTSQEGRYSDLFRGLDEFIVLNPPSIDNTVLIINWKFGQIKIKSTNLLKLKNADEIILKNENIEYTHNNITKLLFNCDYCSFIEKNITYVYNLKNMERLIFNESKYLDDLCEWYSINGYFINENYGRETYLWNFNLNKKEKLEYIADKLGVYLDITDELCDKYENFSKKIMNYYKNLNFKKGIICYGKSSIVITF